MCALFNIHNPGDIPNHLTPSQSNEITAAIRSSIQKQLSLEHPAPFANLSFLAAAASHAPRYQSRYILESNDPNDSSSISMGGLRLSLSILQDVYRNLWADIVDAQRNLLLGLDLSNVDFSNIFDPQANSVHLYGLQAREDTTQHYLFVKQLFTHVSQRPVTIHGDPSTPSIAEDIRTSLGWDIERIHSYLHDYHVFMAKMLLLIHLNSGMPARATELATYSLVDCGDIPRTMRYQDGRIFFAPTHNKSDWRMNETKNVCRFLDDAATRLLLVDSLIVRPFVEMLIFIDMPDKVTAYRQYLFVGPRNDPIQPEYIRSKFHRLFKHYSNGIPLHFIELRHAMKYDHCLNFCFCF